MNFTVTAGTFEGNQTLFTFTAGPLKVAIHAGPCMHCSKEIQPLLRGKDYKYGDCNFDICQSDGMTNFFLDNSEGTQFDITVPTSECLKALKFWVERSQERSHDEQVCEGVDYVEMPADPEEELRQIRALEKEKTDRELKKKAHKESLAERKKSLEERKKALAAKKVEREEREAKYKEKERQLLKKIEEEKETSEDSE